MHIGNKAKPFQINNVNEQASNIINKTVFDWLDFNVINGTFGNGIGLNIKTPSINTINSAIFGLP